MKRKIKDLTLQFVPYTEISNLTPYKKIKKLLDMIDENKILIIQGKLEPHEEKDLIEETMRKIGTSKKAKFRGIELASLVPNMKNSNVFDNFKTRVANMLVGERDALTIIGPATIVKEIKRDPSKMQLLLKT
ncbi:hypothetical protein CO154_00845 [Candidatus Pacearchaeota archaeon CG_4_9_14_3_um_filter_31_7]|nr:MAG: hypothetical protein AUJ10_02840 [Candidatus Pacearchaeota archaeon CG1_02_31_27]PIN92090.1 MAG: hypothetical protein COU55_02800 [Candidatus Pacearchaeota archaeon CG10_big_fil_rev_8_21_14_0_10_31_59]PIZ80305.1 MAG: hypothetical protein COX99_02905 [Candidatus Pacearchaeota archaeon CG_4_10_14_0_2_um_filter_31_10]PJA70821.1 MAG: hypothetical protein CO154_00845 [Candidatus Pacearchaeota archaeon CG_4_9_14_3_um_filter_31_7]